MIPHGKDAPPRTDYPRAVVIEGDVYMFGGFVNADWKHTNAVWRLTRTPKRCFEWRKGTAKAKEKTPSPRDRHSVWEYKGQLWTFAGFGLPLTGYLNDHGDFSGDNFRGQNNQLLCYDPLSEDWRNLKPSGTIPEPRLSHVSAIIGDKVWVYGGFSIDTNPGPNIHRTCDELYQLNMVSLTWSGIQTEKVKPPSRNSCSFTAVSENQIVLHGGCSASNEWTPLNDTWVLNLSSLSWKRHDATKHDPRFEHTGNACTNSSVIIIGGTKIISRDEDGLFQFEADNAVFPVELEPKTLQQLAIQKIYSHRDVLPWKLLPKSLKARFLFPDDECADAGKQQTCMTAVG